MECYITAVSHSREQLDLDIVDKVTLYPRQRCSEIV